MGTVGKAIDFFGKKLAMLAAWARGDKPPSADQILRYFQDHTSADIAANFRESRTPDGKKWAPLKWRVGMPLILTGTLMAAAVGAWKNAQWASAGRIAVTMNTPKYWQFQNYGTSRIPARTFLGPRQETLQGLMKLVTDSLAYEIMRDEN